MSDKHFCVFCGEAIEDPKFEHSDGDEFACERCLRIFEQRQREIMSATK